MKYNIFDRISKKYNVKIKVAKFKRDVPSIFSKNRNVFYINKKHSLESQTYSIFHTLAHNHLGTVCSESTVDEEKAADNLTYELLIPIEEIKDYIDYSLFKLKEIFPYCSFETIAKRLRSLKKNILTIWHNYTLVFRENSSSGSFNVKLDPFEIECMNYSYKTQDSIGRANENRKLRCFSYFIKEESRKKVILFTERINI